MVSGTLSGHIGTLMSASTGRASTGRGSILGSMSMGINTRRETVLHNTRKASLIVLRTRHEHCVDKFLVERNRTRSLVGFIVVVCEGLPLACMNVYLISYGCDYKAHYTALANAGADTDIDTTGTQPSQSNAGELVSFCTEVRGGEERKTRAGREERSDFATISKVVNISCSSQTEDADQYLLFILVLVMSVVLVGWKLKELYEIWNMNRRIKHLELLIAVETEDAFDLIDSVADLEHAVETEKNAKDEIKKKLSSTEAKLSDDIASAVKEGGGTGRKGGVGTFNAKAQSEPQGSPPPGGGKPGGAGGRIS